METTKTEEWSPDRDGWLLLIYRVPPEPSSNRVWVWRELKRVGTLYLQNCACLVPNHPDLEQSFLAIRDRIDTLGGTSYLVKIPRLSERDGKAILAEFRALVSLQYEERRLSRNARRNSPKRSSSRDSAATTHSLKLKRSRETWTRSTIGSPLSKRGTGLMHPGGNRLLMRSSIAQSSWMRSMRMFTPEPLSTSAVLTHSSRLTSFRHLIARPPVMTSRCDCGRTTSRRTPTRRP